MVTVSRFSPFPSVFVVIIVSALLLGPDYISVRVARGVVPFVKEFIVARRPSLDNRLGCDDSAADIAKKMVCAGDGIDLIIVGMAHAIEGETFLDEIIHPRAFH